MIYLGYPIDFSRIDIEVEHLKRFLQDSGVPYFDPGRAYSGTDLRSIGVINEAARSNCAGMVAVVNDSTVTFGVPVEIERCLVEGIPVAIFTTDVVASKSVQIQDWIGKGATVFHDYDYVVDWAREQNRRPIEEGPALVLKVTGEGELPTRHYVDDAGFDLFCQEEELIEPSEFKDFDCGIHVEFPEGYWGWIVGRSSTIRQKGLLVNQGIIDGGYRGPIFAGVWNLNDNHVWVRKGERIAQLIPMKNHARDFIGAIRVRELSESDRGQTGFGSTGV